VVENPATKNQLTDELVQEPTDSIYVIRLFGKLMIRCNQSLDTFKTSSKTHLFYPVLLLTVFCYILIIVCFLETAHFFLVYSAPEMTFHLRQCKIDSLHYINMQA